VIRFVIPAILIVLSIHASAAQADEVFLDDGSRIVGKVKSMVSGKLTVETAFAGTLDIDVKHVKGVNSDEKLIVALESGDRASGALEYDPQSGQKVKGTAFGDVPVKLASVTAIGDGSKALASADVAAVHAEYEEEMAKLKKHEPKWTAKAEVGLNGQTGNKEVTNFNGRVEARRKTDVERLLMYAQGRFSREDGERSANEIIGGIEMEFDLDEKWFAFGKAAMEFDEFEHLDLRSTVTAGLGRFFWEKDDEYLKGLLGAGYRHESFDNGVSQDEGILELTVDFRKELADWLTLTHKTTYQPGLNDLADYRVMSETAGEIPLADSRAWYLRVGMRNEYDAAPQPGVKRLDTYYFLNLVYNLIQ